MKKARIAVSGVGWWGTVGHLEPLLKDEKAEVAAIWSRTEAKVKQRAEKYGVKRAFTNYEEMIDSTELDGVVVSSTPNMHYSQAKYALEHDLNVLVEKPFMLHAEQAIELGELAQARGKFITVCHPLIFLPAMTRARQLIREELGKLFLVQAHFSQRVIDLFRSDLKGMFGETKEGFPLPSASSYADPEVSGGGEAHAQASHVVGSMLWLTESQPLEVFAFMDKQDVAVDVVDAVSIRLENGLLGTMSANGNTPARCGMHQMLIQGEHGYIFVEDTQNKITIRNESDREQRIYRVDPSRDHVERVPGNFVRAILGEEELVVPQQLAINEVRILAGAYRSVETGCKVAV